MSEKLLVRNDLEISSKDIEDFMLYFRRMSAGIPWCNAHWRHDSELLFQVYILANKYHSHPLPSMALVEQHLKCVGGKLVAKSPLGRELFEFAESIVTQYELTH